MDEPTTNQPQPETNVTHDNSNKSVRTKLKKLVSNYKSLPVDSKRLLSLGVIVILLLALPLLVLTIISTRTNFLNRAATGETIEPPYPTFTPEPIFAPFTINESFTGSGPIDLSKWNWSGVVDSKVALSNNSLMVYIPAGHNPIGWNDAVVQPLINGEIPTITRDFDVSVDLVSITSDSGWMGLKFAPQSSITVRRNKVAGKETLEVWTSTNNDQFENKNVSIDIPAGTGNIRVRMVRKGNEIMVYRFVDNTFVSILDLSMSGLNGDGNLPRLVIQNYAPNYSSVTAFFDNYQASAITYSHNLPATPTPPSTPLPTVKSTPTLTPKPTVRPTVKPTVTPTARPTTRPTAFPTTTPSPRSKPVISTNSLPLARLRFNYSATISGYENSYNAGLSMNIAGLPSGLSYSCSYSNGSPNRSTSSAVCKISGVTRSWGVSRVTIKLTDRFGQITSKTMSLVVLPF